MVFSIKSFDKHSWVVVLQTCLHELEQTSLQDWVISKSYDIEPIVLEIDGYTLDQIRPPNLEKKEASL